ncbi:MAG: HAMP domain-containing histidine kinase [Polyangiaceae bacterium]|nr:HAMP domain-containing histidine kinase [Polyangiaceae bacterium]
MEPLRIHLAWLIRLRFGLCLVEVGVAAAAAWGFALTVQPVVVGGVVVATLVTNLLARWLEPRVARIHPGHPALLVALDIVLFTVVLHASGGPENPFGFIYLVPISLAAYMLPPAWMWSLVALILAGSGALFWLQPAEPHAGHHGHGGHQAYALHMQGMWVALGVASIFIVMFVGRLGAALRDRDAELAKEREKAEAAARLAALTTLAAGAAHELATPLATIAVVSQELAKRLRDANVPEALAADARLIREQVARCRTILDRMGAKAGQSRGEGRTHERVAGLFAAALEELPDAGRVEQRAEGLDGADVWVPKAIVVTALRALLQNALDASSDRVLLGAALSSDELTLSVVDRGSGMDAATLEHAREPFFTTKEQGMGLGLFLAASVADQLGGRLEIESASGRGTTARLTIPVEARTP